MNHALSWYQHFSSDHSPTVTDLYWVSVNACVSFRSYSMTCFSNATINTKLLRL